MIPQVLERALGSRGGRNAIPNSQKASKCYCRVRSFPIQQMVGLGWEYLLSPRLTAPMFLIPFPDCFWERRSFATNPNTFT
ncbi:hypothetical protein CEXT_505381 [Caerostris extrusa]|uniref:Uncharacterized protein n=1 Tax=Caerostris extrusa TaxID=172846 RepID=A0AAV4UCR4_CAEEX|nr:hypothetical protein CEXT_505381 [Caerostris extrusa]